VAGAIVVTVEAAVVGMAVVAVFAAVAAVTAVAAATNPTAFAVHAARPTDDLRFRLPFICSPPLVLISIALITGTRLGRTRCHAQQAG
jgi:hypothetical protein